MKVYDKGQQNNLPYNLMRFELRFNKMQKLNRMGIKCLADLKDKDKVYNLYPLLSQAWNDVLLFDDNINVEHLPIKKSDKELLRKGESYKYWKKLIKENVRQYNSQRTKFKNLIKTHGKNEHQIIGELIKNEWENLFKNCTNLPTVQNEKLNEFTVKINSNIVQKRYCKTCGKDISHQTNDSIFCSPKYVGDKTAHKCRNADSNPRNNLRKKLRRINERGVLFDITPYIVDNNNKKQSYAI